MDSGSSPNQARHGAGLLSDGAIDRRSFLKVSAAATGGMLLSLHFPGVATAADKTSTDVFAPNAFVRIDRDGSIALVMPQVEMGQGTYTAMSMLIAEELDVDLAQVRPEHAPPDDKLYGNRLIGFQATGGSTSVRATWEPLRRAGATARAMLVMAAAETWNADASSCRAEKGAVIHTPTGRRLTYGSLAERAARLPVPEKMVLKDPKDFKLIGTPAKRLDTPDKATGKAAFGIDAKIPGMRIAVVATCPVLGGKLATVDDSAAKKVRGVNQVVHTGNAVAVIADHLWAAKQGLDALDIQWDDGAFAKLSTADIVQQLDTASQRQGVVGSQKGDAAKAMAGAARKIEAVYHAPFLAHATMEPVNCAVHVRKDACDVWTGTQVISRAQGVAAEVTGLPRDKVQVHNYYLGGGFGRRLEVDMVKQAVQIAKLVDGPVKVVWTREQDIKHDMFRPYYLHRLAAGLNEQDMPIAWTHRITGSSVVARWQPSAFKGGIDEDVFSAAAGPPYEFANLQVDFVREEPKTIPTAWWRGVGPTHNVYAVESFMDELAVAAKKDPVEYRRSLVTSVPRARAVLDLATEKAGWGRPLAAGSGRGVSLQYAFDTYMSQVAEVTVSNTGEVRVQRVVCAVDCGMTVNPDTLKAQVEGGIVFGLTAALFNEITFRDGRVEQSNFNDYRMLRINETPVVEVYHVKSAEPPGGAGETGTVGIAPAVLNAIFSATGKRIRKLPVIGNPVQAT
ncbi:MAG: isoquinoline 1-oxidoreductase subunit beta [Rhodospirillaceae bacterium]|nr:isoquinoline 1-oxidoreductase subunit beta [Rhodospirillaceae bacterium]